MLHALQISILCKMHYVQFRVSSYTFKDGYKMLLIKLSTFIRDFSGFGPCPQSVTKLLVIPLIFNTDTLNIVTAELQEIFYL